MRKILMMLAALILLAAPAAQAQIVNQGSVDPTMKCQPGMFYLHTATNVMWTCVSPDTWARTVLSPSSFSVGKSTSGYTFGTGLGPELAPAIAPANWTCGAGWDCSVVGVLDHNTIDGAGTAAVNPAITPTIGTTYRLVITVGACTVNAPTVTVGGASYSTTAATPGTYTFYFTASTTANLIIGETNANARFTINAISLQTVTPSGDVEIRGKLYTRGPIVLSRGTATGPSISNVDSSNTGLYFPTTTAINFVANGTAIAGFSSNVGAGFQLAPTAPLAWGTATPNGGGTDTFLLRDNAANTLAMRNGGTAGAPVPQEQRWYAYCDGANCATGYERVSLWNDSNVWKLSSQAAGTGTIRPLGFYVGSSGGWLMDGSSNWNPTTNDGQSIGYKTVMVRSITQARATMGYKQKTITDTGAVAFDRLDLPQTVGSNMTSGVLLYHVHCDDGTLTTYADRSGEVAFSCNNISGTEACVFDTTTAQTVTQAATYSLAVPTWGSSGGTDTVDLTVADDCGGVVGPTNMWIRWRLNLLTPQTETPQ